MTFLQRLASLGYDSYEDYLSGEHWCTFKQRYKGSRRKKLCLVCGSRWYELHHVTYVRLGGEHLNDVIPLCRRHHEMVHRWLKDKGKSVEKSAQAVKWLKAGVKKKCKAKAKTKPKSTSKPKATPKSKVTRPRRPATVAQLLWFLKHQ